MIKPATYENVRAYVIEHTREFDIVPSSRNVALEFFGVSIAGVESRSFKIRDVEAHMQRLEEEGILGPWLKNCQKRRLGPKGVELVYQNG